MAEPIARFTALQPRILPSFSLKPAEALKDADKAVPEFMKLPALKGSPLPTPAISIQGGLLGTGVGVLRKYRQNKFYFAPRWAKCGGPATGLLGAAYTGYLVYHSLEEDTKNRDGIKVGSYFIGRNTIITASTVLGAAAVTVFIPRGYIVTTLAVRMWRSGIVGLLAGTVGGILGTLAYDKITERYYNGYK